MANILIWGTMRELLPGELPLGITAEEVDSLAALQAALDRRASTLILTSPARIDGERPGVEAWVKSGARRRALLVAIRTRPTTRSGSTRSWTTSWSGRSPPPACACAWSGRSTRSTAGA
jgi:hypothetical protein